MVATALHNMGEVRWGRGRGRGGGGGGRIGQRRKKEAKEGEWGEEERRSWGRGK